MTNNEKTEWTTKDWIRKLKQQADDSKEYRHRLYERVDLKNKTNILDVGCGTGAVTADLASVTKGKIIGIDIDDEKLHEAERVLADVPNVKIMKADVHELPFDDETFDLVVFNIVLMHIKDQEKGVKEMARVTRKHGFVLGALEPDYSGRIEYPKDPVFPMLLETLRELGADLNAGRKLKVLFNKAGLKTEVGMDTEWEFLFPRNDEKSLEKFLENFWTIEKILRKNKWTDEQIEKHRTETANRIKDGLSFAFTPCFYAIGKKVV